MISQLKILQRADVKASKFDKEVWANELGPVLNLWKKLNSVSNFVHLLFYRQSLVRPFSWYLFYLNVNTANVCNWNKRFYCTRAFKYHIKASLDYFMAFAKRYCALEIKIQLNILLLCVSVHCPIIQCFHSTFSFITMNFD